MCNNRWKSNQILKILLLMFAKLIIKAINEINEMKLCNFFLNILSYDFGRDN